MEKLDHLMPDTTTLRGYVIRTFYEGLRFSAGKLRAIDGQTYSFSTKFLVTVGETVALRGKWITHPTYGRQFEASNLDYDLPGSTEGLRAYLDHESAFKGLGPQRAQLLVDTYPDIDAFDTALRGDLDIVYNATKIPMKVLEAVQRAWIESSERNKTNAYLSGFELTPHQIKTLLDNIGFSVVGVLQVNPYEIIKYVEGYGFKRVDKIARAMGTPKDHPGRIRAGILFTIREAIRNGHCWIAQDALAEEALELLVLDDMNAKNVVRAAIAAALSDTESKLRPIEREGLPPAVTTGAMWEDVSVVLTWLGGAEHDLSDFANHEIPYDNGNLNEKQMQAYLHAFYSRRSVISGKAGTGKTHIIGQIVKIARQADLRVVLAAPTGKAAKRMEELMRERYGLDHPASTLHRLMGYNGTSFADDLIPCDILIIDEVSMVDISLLARVAERVRDGCHVVLVGDHNQLPPVGPGLPLRDIIRHRYATTTELNEVVRQAGKLKVNSVAVLDGKLAKSEPDNTEWVVIDAHKDPLPIQDTLRQLVMERIPAKFGLDPIRDIQVLAPVHKGLLGTKALNRLFQQRFHGDVSGRFAIGDKVIQTKNDYDLNVMNGTQGFVVSGDGGKDGYEIVFVGEWEPIQVTGEKLGNIELAYCLTAHKAQGSEWPCSVVVCHKSHFYADRNWLYTAVTRSSKLCVIVGDRWGLRRAVKKNLVPDRRTFLSLFAQVEPVPHYVMTGKV